MPFSRLFDDKNEFFNTFEEVAENAVELGDEMMKSFTGSELPVKVEERDSKKSLEAGIPLVSGKSELASEEGSFQLVTGDISSVEGESADLEGAKNTFENLVDFSREADLSSFSLSIEEGVFRFETEKEVEESRDRGEGEEF